MPFITGFWKEPLGFCCQASPQTPKRCMKYQQLLHSPQKKPKARISQGLTIPTTAGTGDPPKTCPCFASTPGAGAAWCCRDAPGAAFPAPKTSTHSPLGRFGAAGFSPPGCDSGEPGPPALGAVTRSAPKKAAGGGGQGAVRARSTLGMRAAPWPARARAVTRGTPCAASTVGAVS